MREEAVSFGNTNSLIGIITHPPDDKRQAHLPALIILNAGLLHRVGPHRLYVKMARRLAALGFVALRFDLSGIGDSEIPPNNLSLRKRIINDIQAAMDFLSEAQGIEQFIPIGICSGATFALKMACLHPRIAGVVPIEGYAQRTIRYYLSHLANPTSWWRVITAQKNPGDTLAAGLHMIKPLTAKIMGRFTDKKHAPSQTSFAEEIRLLTERGVDLLLIYAKGSPAFYNFVTQQSRLRDLASSDKLQVEAIEHSDHTFTFLSTQEQLLEKIQTWVQARRNDWLGHRKSQPISSLPQRDNLP